jgi:DNA-binding response OmpR family regulator
VHVLLAADAEWIVDEVTGAIGGDGDTFTVCREGRTVVGQVKEREPDLAILDLQIGSMGGMAVTMDLRLDESAGVLPHVPVLMLLDRRADLHLARRSGAEGWLIKPLDALRVRRAVDAILAGETYTEGLEPARVDSDRPAEDAETAADGDAEVAGPDVASEGAFGPGQSAEEESAPAG